MTPREAIAFLRSCAMSGERLDETDREMVSGALGELDELEESLTQWHRWAAKTGAEYCDGFTESFMKKSDDELRELLTDIVKSGKQSILKNL